MGTGQRRIDFIQKTEFEESTAVQVLFGTKDDIEGWMTLVRRISWNFPGLETEADLQGHRDTVLAFMEKRQALCVKEQDKIKGVILFSRAHNMICCLGVDENCRRCGIASMLLTEALRHLNRAKEIEVSTFCEGDRKGTAPRALYKKFGFVEAELVEEFGYPSQKFVLRP